MPMDTDLTLTGVQLDNPSGALQTGYRISTEHTDGASFSIVHLHREKGAQDSPGIIVKARYSQRIKLDELNLDLRCTALAEGTQIGVRSSTVTELEIPRQSVQGSKVIGAIARQVADLTTNIELYLQPGRLDTQTPDAAVSIEFSTIESPKAPIRKTVLHKIQIRFSS